MVFVHGWGGSSQYWRNTAEVFAGEYDCLLYDLRGFGKSQLPSDYEGIYQLEDYAHDLQALIQHFQIHSFVLNAHSMGASIGALFADLYPEYVKQAIFNCNGIFQYDARAFAAFQKIGGYVVQLRFPWFLYVPGMDRFAIARFLARPIPKGDRRQFLVDFLNADHRAAAGTLLASVNEEMVTRLPLAFQRMSCPTLFLSGEKDRIIPAAMARQAIALNPRFVYAEIPQVGHFPMLEDPITYQQQVKQFLAQYENL